VSRNHLIAGIAILIILGMMGIIGLGLLLSKWTAGKSQLSQRAPVLELTNCAPNNISPCVVSFGIDSDGNTLVNLLVPASFPSDFYLKIIQGTNEPRYECQMVENFQINFYCIGEKLSPGGVVQFMLFASKDNILLAKGDISILGLEFPTLGIVTPILSRTPTEESSQNLSTEAPTPFQITPELPTPTKPSYPNPAPLKSKTPSYP